MKRSFENKKVDRYSSVTVLTDGVIKRPKDKLETLFRILAGLVSLLSFFPLAYDIFSKDRSDLWTAAFLFLMGGAPAFMFARWGNLMFASSPVYGRKVSSGMVWLAVFLTLMFFCVPAFWYIFISKH